VAQVATLEKRTPLATVGEMEVEQRVVVAVEDGDLVHVEDFTG
jgi:hypothetical protein